MDNNDYYKAIYENDEGSKQASLPITDRVAPPPPKENNENNNADNE